MQKLLLSLVAAGMLLLAQTAFAETIVGTVQSIDAEGTILVLGDGTSLTIPEDYDLTSLETGTKVEIEYEVVDDQKKITEVFLTN